VTGYSDVAPVAHGPEFLFGATWKRDGLQLAGWLTGCYRLPIEVAESRIGLRLDEGGLRLALGFDLPFGDRLALLAGLGGGLDIGHVRPTTGTDGTAALEPPSYQATGLLQALLGLRIRLFGSTALQLVVACDVDLSGVSYVVREGMVDRTVLDPWPVRPTAALRLTTDLLGGGS
jgi:hypothetical protein